jgi:hypothetical protein
MPRSAAGAFRILIFAMLLVAAFAACSPAANALPTALPTALPVAAGSAGPAASAPRADASGGPASPLPSGALTDPAEAWPAYAACLRSHGIQVADPVVDVNGDPEWTSGGDIKKLITPKIAADCGPIIAAVTETNGANDRPRRSYSYDSQVAHAACMREHGLAEWPDPDPNDLAAGMPPGYDKRDPKVYAGLVACEHLLVEVTASPSPAQ